MTYIKWKDEVESYLVSLPQEEKQKIFSYFSEMYADKRDAGISEARIIEEFGAPYDVAKKILSESRDAAATQSGQQDGAANVSGTTAASGNNYNYNYYNYNYGGAPAQSPPPDYNYARQQPEKPQPDVFGEGLKMPKKDKPKKKISVWRILFGIIFVIVLTGFTATLIGSALGMIVEGFISIGLTVGALAASQCGGADGAAMIGLGLVVTGAGFILLAPFSALCKFLWRKLCAYLKGA